jgi:hypothetical protein
VTETPICGFGLRDGSMCVTQRAFSFDRCEHHEGLTCNGCRKRTATHECLHDDGMVLCEACEHISGSQHGPRPNPRDVVDEEMSRAVELILEHLDATEELPSTGPQRRAAAVQLWRGLSNHIAMKVLAGMARAESETP